jgi:hypothetical protein
LPPEWPPLPANTGKTRRIHDIDGNVRHLRIEDEIVRPQTGSDRKITVFQKIRIVEDDQVEFRFGYYMIGVKPRARGRWVWVWGQFCLLIPQEDLLALMQEARNRGWFPVRTPKKTGMSSKKAESARASA